MDAAHRAHIFIDRPNPDLDLFVVLIIFTLHGKVSSTFWSGAVRICDH